MTVENAVEVLEEEMFYVGLCSNSKCRDETAKVSELVSRSHWVKECKKPDCGGEYSYRLL